MIFKKDNTLKDLAAKAGIDTKTFTENVIAELDAREILIDDEIEEYYAQPLKECIDRDININEIKDVLHNVGVRKVDGEILDKFGNLVLFGDGDCPECGAHMVFDHESDATCGDGYITPIEPIYEVWVCPVCGYTEERY